MSMMKLRLDGRGSDRHANISLANDQTLFRKGFLLLFYNDEMSPYLLRSFIFFGKPHIYP
jgi:hypothetical protein